MKQLESPFTVKIVSSSVGKQCDLYCVGSYHKVRKGDDGYLWVDGRVDIIRPTFVVEEVTSMPEKTKTCPECGNIFDEDYPFIGDVCIRSYEKLNFLNRDVYREALTKEILLELKNNNNKLH